jgi:signal transduction histidine kinase
MPQFKNVFIRARWLWPVLLLASIVFAASYVTWTYIVSKDKDTKDIYILNETSKFNETGTKITHYFEQLDSAAVTIAGLGFLNDLLRSGKQTANGTEWLVSEQVLGTLSGFLNLLDTNDNINDLYILNENFDSSDLRVISLRGIKSSVVTSSLAKGNRAKDKSGQTFISQADLGKIVVDELSGVLYAFKMAQENTLWTLFDDNTKSHSSWLSDIHDAQDLDRKQTTDQTTESSKKTMFIVYPILSGQAIVGAVAISLKPTFLSEMMHDKSMYLKWGANTVCGDRTVNCHIITPDQPEKTAKTSVASITDNTGFLFFDRVIKNQGGIPLKLQSSRTLKDYHASHVWEQAKRHRVMSIVYLVSFCGVFIALIVGACILILIGQKEIKRQQDLVESKNHELIIANRRTALGDFASVVAHEINNPLTVISGISFELERLSKTDASIPSNKCQDFSKRLLDMVFRMAKITQATQRLARGLENDPMQVCNACGIIEDVRMLTAIKLSNYSIDLKVESKLHEQPDRLIGRHTDVGQAIVVLINNAADAIFSETNPDGVLSFDSSCMSYQADSRSWVKLEIDRDEKFIIFRVVNSGKKMPSEIAARIFDKFFTTKPCGRGTGLGLPTALGIAREHGGDLMYDMNQEHTTFELKIPAEVVERTTENTRSDTAILRAGAA